MKKNLLTLVAISWLLSLPSFSMKAMTRVCDSGEPDWIDAIATLSLYIKSPPTNNKKSCAQQEEQHIAIKSDESKSSCSDYPLDGCAFPKHRKKNVPDNSPNKKINTSKTISRDTSPSPSFPLDGCITSTLVNEVACFEDNIVLCGKCKNASCKIDTVGISIGNAEYAIKDGKYCASLECPGCSNYFEVDNLKLSGCTFTIIAKNRKGKIIIKKWRKADEPYTLVGDFERKDDYGYVKIICLPDDAQFVDDSIQ